MGRDDFLARLALGRSPFQDVPAERGPGSEQNGLIDDDQQYDEKGRPFDPAAEKRRSELRHAQNAVYALVGVVDRTDCTDRHAEPTHNSAANDRKELLEAEDEHGELYEVLFKSIHPVLTWWPDALVARIQAGIYPASLSFASVLLLDFHYAKSDGWRNTFASLMPGFFAHLLRIYLRGCLLDLVSYASLTLEARLKNAVPRRERTFNRTARIEKALHYATALTNLAVDIVLLPLHHHSEAQKLHLAPSWPPLPSWRAFLPPTRYTPTSFHATAWHSPTTTTNPLLSPALLLLTLSQLTHNAPPHFSLGLHTAYTRLHTHLLHTCDYTLEPIDRALSPSGPAALQNLHDPNDDTSATYLLRDPPEPRRIFRSTALAQLIPHWLVWRLDASIKTTALLPLSVLTRVCVARAWLARTGVSARWGAGVGVLASPLTLGALSKLGLGLAVQGLVEAGLFCAVARVVWGEGVGVFGWRDGRL